MLWGYIDPVNIDELRKQFLPVDIPADELMVTLFEAQLTGESPLSWGARYMAPTLSLNGPHWRTLYRRPIVWTGLSPERWDRTSCPSCSRCGTSSSVPRAAGGHWWPGLDLYNEGSTDAGHEIDLLYAEAGTVWVCEVKRSASGLPIKQAEKSCSVASRLNATPVFRAAFGEWGPEIVELAEREGALLVDGSVLVELPEEPGEEEQA